MIEYSIATLSPLARSIPSHHRARDAASRTLLEIFRSEEINDARQIISQLSASDSAARAVLISNHRNDIIKSAHKIMLAIQLLHDINQDLAKGHAPKDQVLIIEKVETSIRDLRSVVKHLPDVHWEPTRSETNSVVKALPSKISNGVKSVKDIAKETI